MNRPSILSLSLALAVAISSAACKKDPAPTDVTPELAAAASGASSAGAAAAAAVKTPAPPPKETGAKFTKKPPVAGTKRTEETKMQMSMKLTMLKKTMEMAEDESSTKEEEVLEVSGDKVTKLKVTFLEDAKSMTEGGKPKPAKPSPIAGKTYVLVSKDNKTTVFNDKEKPAPAAEAKLVQKQYVSFGKPDEMMAALPERALKEGEAVPELAEGLAKEMKAHTKDDKMVVEGVKVTYKGKEGDTGVFEVEMTMRVAEGPFKMAMPLKGKVSLRMADGWPAILALEGPLNFDLTEKDKAQGVEGGGTIKMSSSYAYK